MDRIFGWSPPHGQVHWGVSVPSGKTVDETAPIEYTGWEVDIHLGGDDKGGGGVVGDEVIHPAAPEQGRTVHCYAITVRPM